MREILFRGKRVSDNKWAYGSLLKVTIDRKSAYMIFGDDFIFTGAGVHALNHAMVEPATVGQFTGLTDKDGKKIFEGDIVNCYTFTGMNDYRRGVVHWNEMFCGWYGKESCSLLCGLGEIYEVIGNEYDNPELMEVE